MHINLQPTGENSVQSHSFSQSSWPKARDGTLIDRWIRKLRLPVHRCWHRPDPPVRLAPFYPHSWTKPRDAWTPSLRAATRAMASYLEVLTLIPAASLTVHLASSPGSVWDSITSDSARINQWQGCFGYIVTGGLDSLSLFECLTAQHWYFSPENRWRQTTLAQANSHKNTALSLWIYRRVVMCLVGKRQDLGYRKCSGFHLESVFSCIDLNKADGHLPKSYLGTHQLLSDVYLAFAYFCFAFLRHGSIDLSNVYQLQDHSCVSSCASDCKQWPACERGSLNPNICYPDILWLHQKTLLKM